MGGGSKSLGRIRRQAHKFQNLHKHFILNLRQIGVGSRPPLGPQLMPGNFYE